MSLKDTIRGAREEAAASGNPFERKKDSSAKAEGTSQVENEQGFTRRSTSRAKPSREKAAGVRKASSSSKKSTATMSKEERKAERKREQEKEDRRAAVAQMLLDENPEYQELHKIWWRILIVGLIFMIIALLFYMLISQQGETAPLWMAVMSITTMVLAYVAVISAFVYDWRKIRPMRRVQENRAMSMSEKRINKALRERDKNKK